MEIKGMKGLHNICKAKSAGLSLPDKTAVGEDIFVVLKVSPKTTKEKLRNVLNELDADVTFHGTFTEAAIVAHKDLD